MTIANCITSFRLLMIPAFLTPVYFYVPGRETLRLVAVVIYVASALTDMLDGYVARRFNQRTRLGARLDPLADKLTVNMGFVFIAANAAMVPSVPQWFPALVLARDIGIVAGAYVLDAHYRALVVRPSRFGKALTLLLMITLGFFLAGWRVAAPAMWMCSALVPLSFIEYFTTGWAMAFTKKT